MLSALDSTINWSFERKLSCSPSFVLVRSILTCLSVNSTRIPGCENVSVIHFWINLCWGLEVFSMLFLVGIAGLCLPYLLWVLWTSKHFPKIGSLYYCHCSIWSLSEQHNYNRRISPSQNLCYLPFLWRNPTRKTDNFFQTTRSNKESVYNFLWVATQSTKLSSGH